MSPSTPPMDQKLLNVAVMCHFLQPLLFIQQITMRRPGRNSLRRERVSANLPVRSVWAIQPLLAAAPYSRPQKNLLHKPFKASFLVIPGHRTRTISYSIERQWGLPIICLLLYIVWGFTLRNARGCLYYRQLDYDKSSRQLGHDMCLPPLFCLHVILLLAGLWFACCFQGHVMSAWCRWPREVRVKRELGGYSLFVHYSDGDWIQRINHSWKIWDGRVFFKFIIHFIL